MCISLMTIPCDMIVNLCAIVEFAKKSRGSILLSAENLSL